MGTYTAVFVVSDKVDLTIRAHVVHVHGVFFKAGF